MSEQMYTDGQLNAHGSVVYFENGAGGFDIRYCPSPEANAKRLAACWNACADFEDPETAIANIQGDYAIATLHRDKLLEALKQCADALDQDPEFNISLRCDARTLIAEIEASK